MPVIRRRERSIVYLLKERKIKEKKFHVNELRWYWDNTATDEPGPAVELLSDFRFETVLFKTRVPLPGSEDEDMKRLRRTTRSMKQVKRLISEGNFNCI